jgi:tRNA A-37 threonylcarbamoyl transferase component Bud32/tetratricopeptide (TPR) repeat protein
LGGAGGPRDGAYVWPRDQGKAAVDELQARLQAALPERYVVKHELGRGGMALVYLAWDRQHDCEVALKVLRPELSASLGPARFLQEIKTAARLRHPYIRKLHDSGQAGDLLYYTMPYVEGESLRERLQREGQLPVADALRIAREVAEALHHAHAKGIVHRDIKPENILFEGGHALVSDFGIALAISEADSRNTGSGVVLGTLEYMSPEQASGKSELDSRTDIYSLGLVLYEMLTGQVPRLDVDGTAKTLERLRPEVATRVSEVVKHALASNPDDRYANAGDFADALARVGGARPFYDRRSVKVFAMPGAALLAFGMWWFVGNPPKPLDQNKVVVYPLTDHRQPQVGEEVALMIGSALEHTEPLKWFYGWTWLDARQRADVTSLTAADARRITRDRGARYYIEGSVLNRGDSTKVILRLNDALGDSLVGQESAAGGTHRFSPAQLGLQAMNRLLPRLVEPGRRVDLSSITERAPAAVASWIQGERAYRMSRFEPALDYYRRAVAADSTMTAAALKGAQAAVWMNRFPEAAQLITIALRHETQMPTRQLYLARGIRSYLAGGADSAVFWFDRAVADDSEWSEGQMWLGEALYHLLPSTPVALDSGAEAAFLVAAASDAGFSPPLVHLAEISIRRRDLMQVEHLMERFREFGPGNTQLAELELMRSCIRGDLRVWERTVAIPAEVLGAARTLGVAAAQPRCAAAGFRSVLRRPDAGEYRWGAALGLHAVLVAEGKDQEATALLDSAIAAGTRYANILFFLDALAGAPTRARAGAIAAEVRQAVGDRYERLTNPESEWIFGVWHASEGDTLRLKALQQALVAQSQRVPERATVLLARALTAHLVLARGDTTDAIDILRRLVPSATQATLEWHLSEPLPVERLLLARLLFARRHHAEALRVASAFDQPAPVVYISYVPASLVLRYRIASAMGSTAAAASYRDRLRRLGREDLLASR